jgi:sugar (pentulose or hexulose) kinase
VAFVGLGQIDSFEKAAELIEVDRVFEPDPTNFEVYDRLYEALKDYYKKNKNLWKRLNVEGH